jgi:hypothetical protein
MAKPAPFRSRNRNYLGYKTSSRCVTGAGIISDVSISPASWVLGEPHDRKLALLGGLDLQPVLIATRSIGSVCRFEIIPFQFNCSNI